MGEVGWRCVESSLVHLVGQIAFLKGGLSDFVIPFSTNALHYSFSIPLNFYLALSMSYFKFFTFHVHCQFCRPGLFEELKQKKKHM